MKKILIVEDSLPLAAHWTSLLEQDGFQVIHESTTTAAVDCLKTMEIDLVITDMAICDASGLPSLHGGLIIISYIALNISIPPKVLAVSGLDSESTISETFQLLDAGKALVKPIADETLRERVRFLLNQQDQEIAERAAARKFQRELMQNRFAMDHSSHGVFWVRKDASIQYANLAAEKMLGYSREELCALTVGDIDPVFPMATWDTAWKHWQESGPDRRESIHRRRDGSTYQCEVTISSLIFEKEEFLHASFEDISQRIAAQKELDRTRSQRSAMLELLGNSDGVWNWKVGSDEAQYAPGFRKILGFDGADKSGFPDTLTAFDYRIHPEDKDSFWEAVDLSFRQQTPLVHEMRVRCQNGSYIWVRNRATASFDHAGRAIKLVGSVYDISIQKELEMERDRLFNTAVELFALVDLTTLNWLKISPSWSTLFGYDLEEMLESMSLLDVHPPEEHQTIREQVTQLISGESIRGWILPTYHQDGSLRYIEWNIDPPLLGETTVYASGRDVTTLREYMQQVEKHSFELESLNSQLRRSNEDLGQFAYVASHDLQEPLRAISGFLQLLKGRYQNQLDEKAIGYIDKSVQGASRMSQLINDLLHYSRVTREEKEFSQVQLSGCVKLACEKLAKLIEDSKASIQLLPLPEISGIELLLVQMFQNLIGNAIKYRSDQPIQIKIYSDSNATENIVHVQDNGIGIAPEYQKQVFALFKRLHHRGEHAGTGIGLAICRRVAERHNANIEVQSTAGKGSCFTIRFPKNPRVSRSAQSNKPTR